MSQAWWMLLARVLLLAAGVAVLHPAQAQPASGSPQVIAKRLSQSAWYVEGLSALGSPANQNFISNAGFIVTPEGVLVIDALGSPALAQRLLAEIRCLRKSADTPIAPSPM
jgi:hypothetical protein